MYVLTFGGDPITTEAIGGAAADDAKAAVDDWWFRQMGSGRVLLGARLAGPHAATTVRFAGGSSPPHRPAGHPERIVSPKTQAGEIA